jgi:hypothetical protein
MRKLLLGAALVAAMAIGGALGPSLIGAGAATTSTTTGAFEYNENTSHESSEDAARETAEDNGTATFGDGGSFRPNEDATHEAGESKAREAEEDAGTAPSSTSAP